MEIEKGTTLADVIGWWLEIKGGPRISVSLGRIYNKRCSIIISNHGFQCSDHLILKLIQEQTGLESMTFFISIKLPKSKLA